MDCSNQSVSVEKNLNTQNQIKDYIYWAENHDSIRSDTSELTFLGPNIKLTDFRVKSARARGDDEVYQQDEKIRKLLPRGMCILSYLSNETETILHRVVLSGLKKFTGRNNVDEDSIDSAGNLSDESFKVRENFGKADSMWLAFFSEPIERTHRVVLMKKENGEALHFSCVHLKKLNIEAPEIINDELGIGSQYLLIVGSKNNHLGFRSLADIEMASAPRFQTTRPFAREVFKILLKMEIEKRKAFIEHLANNEVTGVFEFLNPDHQHVENFTNFKRPLIQFLTWSSHCFQNLGLPVLPPDEGIRLAQILGWPDLSSFMIKNSLQESQHLMEEIRLWYGIEGCVVYFLNTDNITIGMLKHKTLWYIILRAIRQKARTCLRLRLTKPNQFSLSNFVTKITCRIAELAEWLPMDEDCVIRWRELGASFIRYISYDMENILEKNDLESLFPYYWQKFLKDKNLSDKLKVLSSHIDPPEIFVNYNDFSI